MYSCQVQGKIPVLLSGDLSLAIYMNVHLGLIFCLLNSSGILLIPNSVYFFPQDSNVYLCLIICLSVIFTFQFTFPSSLCAFFKSCMRPLISVFEAYESKLYSFYVICRGGSAITVAVEEAEYLLSL